VILTHAFVWILVSEKIRARGRTTFGTGIAVPFVVLPPASRSWASAVPGRGSHDHGVLAASSIPQGVRGSNHSHNFLVVSGTYRFSHERRWSNQKHCEKKIIV
jgi:hypothetical protein